MKHLVTAALSAVFLFTSSLAAGQSLIEFRNDLAFSAAEVDAVAARTFERRLASLNNAGRLDPDPALELRLQRIFPRLLLAALDEHPAALRLPWELRVCSRCEEAAALPGGRLMLSCDFVSRLAFTDDELAYVIAHEMAHVLAEHTREFATAARFFLDNGRNRYYADIERELGENLRVQLRMAPVAAQQELEADRIGTILGARAGFAPEAMLSLLGKMSTVGGSFMSTHPGDDERLRQAHAMLETARRLVASTAPDRRDE